MIELPTHVEARLYEIFMELSVPRILKNERLEKGDSKDEQTKSA
ncbi:hypothetical protein [Bacillus altitudinis]|nr:hypothetical protein [Bacillus altitudinis]